MLPQRVVSLRDPVSGGLSAAVVALVLLASLLLAAVPARAALSGSIVFIRDGDVWIMAADDPAGARAVTRDGTPERPYIAPVQSSDGVIYAVTADGFGEIVRLNQRGEPLGAPFRPQTLDKIDDLDLSPDGTKLAVTSLESVQTPLGFLFSFFLDIARADGGDSSALPQDIDLPYAGWYSDSGLAGTQYVEDHFDISGLSAFELGDAQPSPWHDTCRREPFALNPFPEGCYLAQQPDFTADLERMATIGEEVESLEEPPRVIVWDLAGAPPAAPAPSCTLDGEIGGGRFDRPTWSPDGDGLAWALASSITGDEPAGAGVYVAEGFASGDCEQAFAEARLVAPGGSWPDWSSAGLGSTPDPTDPTDPTGPMRLAGAGRAQTAVAISRADFADGEASAVVLARADAYPDALAGTPLAADVDGPLLITSSNELLEEVAQEIRRVLSPGGTVYLLGGEAALDQSVESSVGGLGFGVDRIAGASRIETSVAVAERLDGARSLLVTTGYNFPDALAAGAAAAADNGAVLLTAGDDAHPAVDAYLAANGEVAVYAVGGPAVGAYPDAHPVSGATRDHTAVEVAQAFFADPAVVALARNDTFPDALAGGAFIGRMGGPLLLTPPRQLSAPVADYLSANADTLTSAALFGGEAAISNGVAAQIQSLLD